ncbi:MAG: F0F1 ATP synthase subunit gamma [Candidatus Omnitrophica bacterium]|nr:F0F1 ATP synthase subunit gamma [Candidatus Omnitrophota bacterium]
MQKITAINRKIQSTEQMQSVVKTMKVLSAVNIRHYSQAVEALGEFSDNLHGALGLVLERMNLKGRLAGEDTRKSSVGIIVFGSQRGLSGRFNEQVISRAFGEMEKMNASADAALICVGKEVASRIRDRKIDRVFSFPGSDEGIIPLINEMLIRIESWRSTDGIENIYIYNNRPVSGAAFSPGAKRLFPLDEDWLKKLEGKKWPTKMLPLLNTPAEELFSSLIRQHFFVSIYESFMDSLAAENASRLAAMQAAEKNIEEKMDELRSLYNHLRQSSITAELLDIISGFEALEKKR